MINPDVFTQEVIKKILKILRNGDTVELKKVQGEMQVIEIKRKKQ